MCAAVYAAADWIWKLAPSEQRAPDHLRRNGEIMQDSDDSRDRGWLKAYAQRWRVDLHVMQAGATFTWQSGQKVLLQEATRCASMLSASQCAIRWDLHYKNNQMIDFVDHALLLRPSVMFAIRQPKLTSYASRSQPGRVSGLLAFDRCGELKH
jgi:hypothetical protein